MKAILVVIGTMALGVVGTILLEVPPAQSIGQAARHVLGLTLFLVPFVLHW